MVIAKGGDVSEEEPASDVRMYLPQYPAAPASLTAAATFYTAARAEILERVRFRDQVMIAVITAIFVFLGAYGQFLFVPVSSLKIASFVDLTSYAVNLLFICVIICVGAVFLVRYSGYQNAKIAELGYFISSIPAKHLQDYGRQELSADAIEIAGQGVRKSARFVASDRADLRKTLQHWDRYAVDLEINPKLNANRDSFSQDGILKFIIMGLSFLPIVVTTLFAFKFSIPFFTLPPHTALEVVNVAILVVATAMGAACPYETSRLFELGQGFKRRYTRAREGIKLAE